MKYLKFFESLGQPFVDPTEMENKFGIEPMEILLRFCRIMDHPGKYYNRFKSYIVSQIQRGITREEENKLGKLLLSYIDSDPGTKERIVATNSIIKLEFLDHGKI